jgi:ZIP family zinc transporter
LGGLAAPGTTLNTGIVAFGVAALCYLVTEELLLEAHETTEEHGEGHIWWVDMAFFAGFMLSFIMEKFNGPEEGIGGE